jgi:hypothetical protein
MGRRRDQVSDQELDGYVNRKDGVPKIPKTIIETGSVGASFRAKPASAGRM